MQATQAVPNTAGCSLDPVVLHLSLQGFSAAWGLVLEDVPQLLPGQFIVTEAVSQHSAKRLVSKGCFFNAIISTLKVTESGKSKVWSGVLAVCCPATAAAARTEAPASRIPAIPVAVGIVAIDRAVTALIVSILHAAKLGTVALED